MKASRRRNSGESRLSLKLKPCTDTGDTHSPSSQGATHSSLSACLMMVSGRGRECLTMAPYSPYSAMMLPRPQVLLVFLSLALLFWNQT